MYVWKYGDGSDGDGSDSDGSDSDGSDSDGSDSVCYGDSSDSDSFLYFFYINFIQIFP